MFNDLGNPIGMETATVLQTEYSPEVCLLISRWGWNEAEIEAQAPEPKTDMQDEDFLCLLKCGKCKKIAVWAIISSVRVNGHTTHNISMNGPANELRDGRVQTVCPEP